MERKELATIGKELFAKNLGADAEGTTWAIVVSVGMDGTEKKVFVQPTDHIAQLKVQVQEELGVSGKMYRTDTEELEELLDDETINSCLVDEALVWLDSLLDEFTAAKEALLAIRDTHASIIGSKRGWGKLETFTEMDELGHCEGVTVEDGHVTKLNFCGWNLTELPALPATLTKLYCSRNKITTIPALPATLKILECGANSITVIPTLPSTLKVLNCYGNSITELPALPSKLRVLNCGSNKITVTAQQKAAIQAQAPNCTIYW